MPVLSEKTLKKVVQEAVTDDDRSRNVIVFGLADDASEDLNNNNKLMLFIHSFKK